MIQSSLFLLLYDEQGGAVGGRSILGGGEGGRVYLTFVVEQGGKVGGS